MNTLTEKRIAIENIHTPASEPVLACPSAQPDWEGARIFGIVGGSAEAPRVAYLAEPQQITPDLLAQTAPLPPTEVLRIAAPCVKESCQHFEGHRCQLAARTVEHLDNVTDKLPVCTLRSQCRWYHEQGKAACFRCPQVITDGITHDAQLIQAATPAPAAYP